MLAGDSEIHGAVLNNDISAVEELLKNKTDVNISDKCGRTVLHLAASYNSPLTQKLLSLPNADANKTDDVLKWTPLRYADRTKSWMAMNILLQNGTKPDDIVLTKSKSEAREWEQRALWQCASKGHRKLLEFLLNCGYDVNAVVEVPENQQVKYTLFHRASFGGQTEVVRILFNRRSDINIRTAKSHTALHLAAESGSVDIIKLLLDEGMSVNLTNTNGNSPLHFSALLGKLEATKTLVERGAALNDTNIYGNTPLMLAAFKSESEIFRYLTKSGADINICDKNDDSALHLNITNKYGNTPLMVAALRGKTEVFLYLKENGANIGIRSNDNDIGLH